MIEYSSEKQLSIYDFKTPFQTELSSDNRWVELAKNSKKILIRVFPLAKVAIKYGWPLNPKEKENLEEQG